MHGRLDHAAAIAAQRGGALRAFAGQNSEGRFFTEETPWTVCVHDGLQFAAPVQQSDTATEERTPQREELPADFAALSYRYPYAEQTAFPAKLTATQLKGRAIDEEISENTTLPPRLRNLCKPKFLAGKTALTGTERGTALHLVMQDLDFFCEPNEQSVHAQIEAMRAQRKLTEEQAKAADVYAIVRVPAERPCCTHPEKQTGRARVPLLSAPTRAGLFLT